MIERLKKWHRNRAFKKAVRKAVDKARRDNPSSMLITPTPKGKNSFYDSEDVGNKKSEGVQGREEGR